MEPDWEDVCLEISEQMKRDYDEMRMIDYASNQTERKNAEWASWEYLIREDLQRLENRLQALHGAISVHGIGRKYRDEFVTTKLIGLIREVTAEPNALRPPRLKALTAR